MFKSIWYYSLFKPPLAPPDIIFATVWIVLYSMMLISFIIYMLQKSDNKCSGYVFFVTQLLLNLAWAPSFFGLKNIAYALFIIILLDLFVLLTIISFYKVAKVAAIILLPYFIWILFATYLNFGYLILNR